MAIILVFGVTLLVVVLISGFAARTVLSTALLFLAAGALTGNGGLNWIDIKPNDPVVVTLADLALFSVLYTDGMRAALPALKATGATAGRALGLGMPLTFIGIALLTKALTPMDWTASFLVGAILSPTDPVFAAAIIGRTDVPLRLRRLLNVESGLNDGLALPVVVVLIAVASHGKTHVWTVVGELAGGIALGIAMPLAAHLLARLHRQASAEGGDRNALIRKSPRALAAAAVLASVLALSWVLDYRYVTQRMFWGHWQPVAERMLTACERSTSGTITTWTWGNSTITIPCSQLRR